jgi:hypothetical protein
MIHVGVTEYVESSIPEDRYLEVHVGVTVMMNTHCMRDLHLLYTRGGPKG